MGVNSRYLAVLGPSAVRGRQQPGQETFFPCPTSVAHEDLENHARVRSHARPLRPPLPVPCPGKAGKDGAAAPEHQFIRVAIDLHDTYSDYVVSYFGSASLFHKALKEAFETFCNKQVPYCGVGRGWLGTDSWDRLVPGLVPGMAHQAAGTPHC